MAQTIDKIVKSKYPPKDKNVMWVDTNSNPPVQKIWDGTWKPMEVNENVDYKNHVVNKPTINGVEVTGALTNDDLKLEATGPFKGWFDSSTELNTKYPNPYVGDFAYVHDASPATTVSIYRCVTAGTWADSGDDVDTSLVQTFASGEEVNEVHIVNDLTTGGEDDVLNAEQGLNLCRELVGSGAITIGGIGYQHLYIKEGASPTVVTNSNYSIIIPIKESYKITLEKASSSLYYAWLTSAELTNGAAPPFAGNQTQVYIISNAGKIDVTPVTGAKYLYIGRASSINNIPISTCIINGVDVLNGNITKRAIEIDDKFTKNLIRIGGITIDDIGYAKWYIDSNGDVINGFYYSTLIPIEDTYQIALDCSDTLYYAWLSSNELTPNASAPFVTGETGRKMKAASTQGTLYSVSVPSGTKYMYLGYSSDIANFPVSVCIINGIDIVGKTIANKVSDIEQQSAKNSYVDDIVIFTPNDYLFFLKPKIALRRDSSGEVTIGDNRFLGMGIMKASFNMIMECNLANCTPTKYLFVENDDEIEFSQKITSINNDIYFVRKGEYFAYEWSQAAGTSFTFSDNNVHENVSVSKITDYKWLALGDSITQGVYSNEGIGGTSFAISWVKVAARDLGFVVTDKAIGGMGYVVQPAESDRQYNLREQLDIVDTTSRWYVDPTQYDLVTIMLGVNDWKTTTQLGTINDDPTLVNNTIAANMKYCIEKLQNANKSLKIIVISPINSAWEVTGTPSTSANNWGIGYSVAQSGNKTLQDVFDLEKEICEYYGIQFIDMLHTSTINRLNIKTMLADNVHPTIEGHKVLGYDIARKIGKM